MKSLVASPANICVSTKQWDTEYYIPIGYIKNPNLESDDPLFP